MVRSAVAKKRSYRWDSRPFVWCIMIYNIIFSFFILIYPEVSWYTVYFSHFYFYLSWSVMIYNILFSFFSYLSWCHDMQYTFLFFYPYLTRSVIFFSFKFLIILIHDIQYIQNSIHNYPVMTYNTFLFLSTPASC